MINYYHNIPEDAVCGLQHQTLQEIINCTSSNALDPAKISLRSDILDQARLITKDELVLHNLIRPTMARHSIPGSLAFQPPSHPMPFIPVPLDPEERGLMSEINHKRVLASIDYIETLSNQATELIEYQAVPEGQPAHDLNQERHFQIPIGTVADFKNQLDYFQAQLETQKDILHSLLQLPMQEPEALRKHLQKVANIGSIHYTIGQSA